ADMGNDFQLLTMGIIADFVSNDPLSMERTAEKTEIRGKKEINGEECYELSCVFPQYQDYEIVWFLSVQSFLPQEKWLKYTLNNGKKGGYIQALSNIKINHLKDPKAFKIEELKD
ncbi:hypothetical protein ACFLT9_03435, partial [Acidobacteriota bacterium]